MAKVKYHPSLTRAARAGRASLTPIMLLTIPTPGHGTWITPKGIERRTKLLPGTIKVMLFRLESQGLVESRASIRVPGGLSYRLSQAGLRERRKLS